MPDADVCDDVERDADAIFAIIDEDGDGSISRVELVLHLVKAGYTEDAVNTIFDKLDADGDETISKEELREGFLRYTPLRSAPGLGNYNVKFTDDIHVDADALFNNIDVVPDRRLSNQRPSPCLLIPCRRPTPPLSSRR